MLLRHPQGDGEQAVGMSLGEASEQDVLEVFSICTALNPRAPHQMRRGERETNLESASSVQKPKQLSLTAWRMKLSSKQMIQHPYKWQL